MNACVRVRLLDLSDTYTLSLISPIEKKDASVSLCSQASRDNSVSKPRQLTLLLTPALTDHTPSDYLSSGVLLPSDTPITSANRAASSSTRPSILLDVRQQMRKLKEHRRVVHVSLVILTENLFCNIWVIRTAQFIIDLSH